MKRSEMQQKIDNWLFENYPTLYDNKQITSHELLNLVESFGMLPPQYLYYNKNKLGEIQPDNENGVFYFEWEPE